MTDPKLDVIQTDKKTESTRMFVLHATQASNVKETNKKKP